MRKFIKMFVAICTTSVLSACALGKDVGGDDSLPRVWCSYSKIANEKSETADLKAHGVDVVGYGCQSVERVREHLAAARSQGLKIFFPITVAGADIEYPRTWGYPEVYGADSYACWMCARHKACAELTREVVDEVHALMPGVKVFRNTTRSSVFSLSNDRDGSAQELLARELDFVHLDPYPVTAKGMSKSIPSDMSYCAGLARRYGKPLLPWMQAHRFGGPKGLCDVSPEQVAEMGRQHFAQGIDALMWLGYGGGFETFPKARPDSWDAAAKLHAAIHAALPPKPKAELAVLRPYATWALSHVRRANVVRNPGDWKLQQFLWVWSVELGRAYDVFEVPPRETQEAAGRRAKELERYRWIVSSEPYPGAILIGADEKGKELSAREYLAVREGFRGFIVQNFH